MWLQRERRSLIAEIAFVHLLEQSRPTRSLSVGYIVETRRLREHWQTITRTIAARVTLKEIILGEGGFSLRTDSWFRIWGRTGVPRVDDHMVIWQGFDSVTDDLGNEYMLKHSESEVLLLFGWSRQHLCMAFYPSVSQNARTLVFASKPLVVELEMHRSGEKPFPLSQQLLGNVECRVPTLTSVQP